MAIFNSYVKLPEDISSSFRNTWSTYPTRVTSTFSGEARQASQMVLQPGTVKKKGNKNHYEQRENEKKTLL